MGIGYRETIKITKGKNMAQRIKNWIFQIVKIIVARRIVTSNNLLSPQYLLEHGWIEEEGNFIEPNVKKRDKIWV